VNKFGRYIRIRFEDLLKAIWSEPLEAIFLETKSSMVWEGDESCVQIRLVCNGQTWFRYRLRDRRHDGPRWKKTPLIDWNYSGDRDKFPVLAVEESVYCLDPRYPLTSVFTPAMADFVKNPFEEIPYDKPDLDSFHTWLYWWKNIFNSENIVYPGYFLAKNIPGIRTSLHKNVLPLVKASGYSYLTAVPTWWHTASICTHLGFKYLYAEDRLKIEEIGKLLSPLGDRSERTRRQMSWVVMLQFWAELVVKSGYKLEEFSVPKEYILRDSEGNILTFPLNPNKNLWLYHKV
jgi:hypothetical protein